MAEPNPRPQICDYEGSSYRTEFWEGKGRDYEDRVERIALRRLLPSGGLRLLEVGAGFGRLTNEYHQFEQIVLLDYSFSQLQYAQEKLGRSSRYVYVAADAYHLPFAAQTFDGATMIRVLHHMAQVDSVLAQVRRVLAPGAAFILEHASKRNLKAILRYAAGRQTWNPNDREPVEFVELNFDFHPDHILIALAQAGFVVERRLPVSYLRIPALKRLLPAGLLAGFDSLLQLTGLLYSPSIFIRCRAVGPAQTEPLGELTFICPECDGTLVRMDDTMLCQQCARRWAVRDGIYDFKAPLDSA
ncbi:MAG: methyltransferase domain-containing protein [Aggregatilineales bacterium]